MAGMKDFGWRENFTFGLRGGGYLLPIHDGSGLELGLIAWSSYWIKI
jgi:hypothetical protein